MIHQLADTLLDLADGGAVRSFAAGPAFWQRLMAGELAVDRLMGALAFTADTPHWEMHPAGEEVLACLSGALDVVLDEPAGERAVALTAGSFTIVPRGVWHRFVVRDPGQLLFVTYGKGTEHRPVA